jgi:hypothetical protein
MYMKVKGYYLLALIILAMLACKQPGANKPGAKNEGNTVAPATAFDLDERFEQADSIVVVFYKDPYGPDSLRYTRYYTQASLTDNASIEHLKKQLRERYAQEEKRACRSEGKIWCFSKGKVFQTVYFSTKCNDCCYLYLIKDGNFYYSQTTTAFAEWLNKIKPTTQEVANQGLEE